MDDQSRIAIVHNWTLDTAEREVTSQADIGENKIRYQYGNHLGSASLELDTLGNLISYEEYFPYGGTSFTAGKSQKEVKLKEYRYTGKERDDFTGLYYYGARYYAPWLGRWMSADPSGPQDGLNLYEYVSSNPILYHDPDGRKKKTKLPDIDRSWEVKPGLVMRSYGTAAQGFMNPNNSWGERGVYFTLAVLTAPAALMEEGGRGIANLPFYASATGQYAARGVMNMELGNTDEAVVDFLNMVSHGSGFISGMGLFGEGALNWKNAYEYSPYIAAETKAFSVVDDTMKPATQTKRKVSTGKRKQGSGGKQKGRKSVKKKYQDSDDVSTVMHHRAGNRQVKKDGQVWHLPENTPASKIPSSDIVGEKLKLAADDAASQWSSEKLSFNEENAIQSALDQGEKWRANLLEQQAKGRWVEKQVKKEFLSLEWSSTGVDAVDPATGISYEILSGTKSNMDKHAKRMASDFFRMITF